MRPSPGGTLPGGLWRRQQVPGDLHSPRLMPCLGPCCPAPGRLHNWDLSGSLWAPGHLPHRGPSGSLWAPGHLPPPGVHQAPSGPWLSPLWGP